MTLQSAAGYSSRETTTLKTLTWFSNRKERSRQVDQYKKKYRKAAESRNETGAGVTEQDRAVGIFLIEQKLEKSVPVIRKRPTFIRPSYMTPRHPLPFPNIKVNGRYPCRWKQKRRGRRGHFWAMLFLVKERWTGPIGSLLLFLKTTTTWPTKR
ncbi:hypothetical protein PsorP6_016413 [Peronosclerospora sorghi]|uniref:Uncharacterized protein n=1 Tax=Peronosclerospora sorghi TaxID=230839 RepID=A0ACC0VQ59_9STRA|nr:hypothetical protein PsorP6_016413 [Peronosclerospora sorghi]